MHKGESDFARPLGPRDPTEKDLARIGRADKARSFVTIEGQGIGSKLLAPKGLFKPLGETVSLAAQPLRLLRKVQCLGAPGGKALRRI